MSRVAHHSIGLAVCLISSAIVLIGALYTVVPKAPANTQANAIVQIAQHASR